jgi:hypothetical protein
MHKPQPHKIKTRFLEGSKKIAFFYSLKSGFDQIASG